MKKRICAIHQGTSVLIEYDEHVYQPGILTRTLSDIMEVRPGDRAIDVGCGTGYLGIVAALLGAAQVIALDPMPEAIQWTNHNARLNGVKHFSVIRGEALDPVVSESADLIITNPPQIPCSQKFSPWRYGGPDGTDIILKIIRQSVHVLRNKGGRLFLVHAALACPAKVRETLSQSGFHWKIIRTVEKELNPADFNAFAPGLTDYLFGLRLRKDAEIYERNNQYFYSVWFYRAELAG